VNYFTWYITGAVVVVVVVVDVVVADLAVADEISKPRTEMKMDDNFMTSLRL
jgi:hypothetical protein